MLKRSHDDWNEKLIRGRAEFVDAHTLQVGGERIRAEKIIIATGSRPLLLESWSEYRDKILTTDEFFKEKRLCLNQWPSSGLG